MSVVHCFYFLCFNWILLRWYRIVWSVKVWAFFNPISMRSQRNSFFVVVKLSHYATFCTLLSDPTQLLRCYWGWKWIWWINSQKTLPDTAITSSIFELKGQFGWWTWASMLSVLRFRINDFRWATRSDQLVHKWYHMKHKFIIFHIYSTDLFTSVANSVAVNIL